MGVALSRFASDPADLHRAGAEALLAANVAEARGEPAVTFEETGAYRLLLPAMSEDPSELQRFHDETVAALVRYDDQYETELLRTLETFLDADGNVAKTAESLFTHRHTIRYRLDRVRELSGLDVGSTDGRERLSLGLKAMRVLGIAPPGGPAREAGAKAGRVPLEREGPLGARDRLPGQPSAGIPARLAPRSGILQTCAWVEQIVPPMHALSITPSVIGGRAGHDTVRRSQTERAPAALVPSACPWGVV